MKIFVGGVKVKRDGSFRAAGIVGVTDLEALRMDIAACFALARVAGLACAFSRCL